MSVSKRGILATMVILAAIFCSPQLFASSSMENWLKQDAVPQLVSVLRDQPRFVGETLRIEALENGYPVSADNALVKQIRSHLRESILAGTRVRLSLWDRSHSACQPVIGAGRGIVLGIDIARQNDREHRIMLALQDREEGIWINHRPQVWVGRLTASERDLLATHRQGEVQVFAGNDAAGIAAAFLNQLDCSESIPQPVYLAVESDPIARVLKTRLQNVWEFTESEHQAHSVLRLSRHQDTLRLEHGSVASPVLLASIRLLPEAEPEKLLTDIRLASRKDNCRGHGRECVDIEFEILNDAYVIEFFTKAGKMHLVRGSDPALVYGERAFGLKIPEARYPGRPSLGYYVLATRDPHLAARLSRVFELADHAEQRAALGALVENPLVTWRALHLAHHRGRTQVIGGES